VKADQLFRELTHWATLTGTQLKPEVATLQFGLGAAKYKRCLHIIIIIVKNILILIKIKYNNRVSITCLEKVGKELLHITCRYKTLVFTINIDQSTKAIRNFLWIFRFLKNWLPSPAVSGRSILVRDMSPPQVAMNIHQVTREEKFRDNMRTVLCFASARTRERLIHTRCNRCTGESAHMNP
jgi:hypothetical protein